MRKNLSVCTQLRANGSVADGASSCPADWIDPCRHLIRHVSDNRTLQPVSRVLCQESFGVEVGRDPGDAEPNLPAAKSANERVVWPITRGCRQGFRNADQGLRGSGLRYSVNGKGRRNSGVDLAYNTLK